jgi:hypothetical protein
MSRLALVASPLVAIAALAPMAAKRRFGARVDREATSLIEQPAAIQVGPAERRARSAALPDPVRRYLRYAIGDDAPAIRSAHLTHGGTFRTAPTASWFPIDGEQYFTTAIPGFVWHATLRPLPLFWIEARDRVQAGRGHMLVKALSLFTLADATGPRIDQGATLRWLGECAWFPYAFVGEAIRWEPIDHRSARATVVQSGLPVTAVFEFDREGRLAGLKADRYRDRGGGGATLTPFLGRYSDYREYGGFRVPTSVEVSWLLEEGVFTYARFVVSSLEYNVSTPHQTN